MRCFFYLLEIWKVHIILQEYTKKRLEKLIIQKHMHHWAQDIERTHTKQKSTPQKTKNMSNTEPSKASRQQLMCRLIAD
jgi:hypothetical protein